MTLRPDEARRLAGVLLSEDNDPAQADESPQGRLNPGPFGRYQIRRLVGIGGMGEVYEAEQDSPRRRVALKVIRPELVSPELRRRFDYESHTLARLQHPSIAKVFDAGQAESIWGATPYFAMEFVEGKALTEFVSDRKLDLRSRLELFLRICEGVEHAHQSGVIHRDLKPANILIDEAGQPRILDFGMARATDHDVRTTTLHTEVGKLIGTLPYMSPEQVAGEVERIDTRSDVYSLGVVLYELLAEKPPYEIKRGLVHEAARVIREEDPTPLSSVSRTFRGDVETIVAKALEKEPSRRYQSVGEMAADIRRFLNDDPIVARRAGTWYHVKRFGRRNRVFVVAAMMVAVMLSGWAVTSLLLLIQQRQAMNQLATTREAERLSRIEAERQAAIAQAVNDFLQKLLSAPGPSADGRNVTVLEVLEHARSGVERSFPDEPEIANAILDIVARMYRELGAYDEAEEVLHFAIERYENMLGPDDPATLSARVQYAQVLLGRGRHQEAERILREVRELQAAQLGPEDPLTLWTSALLASTLGSLDRLTEAEELARATVEAQARVLERTDPRAITSRGYLAEILQLRQKFGEAETVVRGVIEDEIAVFGADSARVASERVKLAIILRIQGQPEEGEAALREAIPVLVQRLGSTHPFTLNAEAALVSALATLGRDEEALHLVRDVLERQIAELGILHPDVAVTMSNLSFLLQRTGQLVRAESVMSEAIEIYRATHGEHNVSTLDSTFAWAKLLDQLGRHEEAIVIFDALLEKATRIDTRPGFYIAAYGIGRGACLINLERFEDAEAQLLECLQRFPIAGQRAHNRILGHLVDLYTDWEKPEEADLYAERLKEATGGS